LNFPEFFFFVCGQRTLSGFFVPAKAM
jgi:hypothetical protein